MKKLLTKIALVAAGFTGVAYGQQDPQFTQFMFNKLIYNPGYAGTSGAICGVAQYRKQWAGFTGAPVSTAVSGDMRLSALPLGIGLNVMTDEIGAMKTFFMRGAAAFNQKIGAGTLGLGIDVGILQKQVNNSWIVPEPLKGDPHIPGAAGTFTNPNFNKVTMDLGFGAFYQIPGKFYVGVSSTHLPAQDIKSGSLGYKVSRHYYFMAGYTFNATPWLDVAPNLLYRTDVSATSFDANLNLTWFKLFWVGGTFRAGENTGAILAGVQKAFGTGNSTMARIGYSYDLHTGVKVAGGGTHELILGVCYTPKIKKETTYSNDRYWGN